MRAPRRLIFTAPSVGPDGTVYVGTEGNKLYAINPNMTVKWVVNLSNDVKSTPLVYDGVVYFGSDDDRFRAVNADTGAQAFPPFDVGSDIRTSPAVADGIIYFGSGNDRVYAMNPNNTMIWNYKTGGDIDSSPALTPPITRADGRKTRTLIVGSDDNYLYGLDADPNPARTAAQRLLWKRYLGGDVESAPAIGDDNKLWARNPDGSLAWSYTTGGDINSSPTLDASGLIYVGSDDGYLYALHATPASMSNTARLAFRVHTGGRAKSSSPMISPDRSLYVGISDRDGLFVVRP